jgi:colanic acid biosynthesis glycosyl transferase WcaI
VGVALSRIWGSKLVISVQDIYPLAAIELGVLKNPYAIKFFEAMERWMYRKADHIVVISEGFKSNLIGKGVPPDKITIVSNWADPNFVKTGPRNESLRQTFNVGDRFTVIYSGGLTLNSELEPLLHAADALRNEPFSFVIIGEGIHKPRLQQLADDLKLTNLQFRPFVPLPQYPDVLLAADVNIVTLNSRATQVSVPSKIYKQMAAGRPVIAIASSSSELARLIDAGKFGFTVSPSEPAKLVEVLRWAAAHPDEMKEMGVRARQYLLENHSRDRSVDRICEMLDGMALAPSN